MSETKVNKTQIKDRDVHDLQREVEEERINLRQEVSSDLSGQSKVPSQLRHCSIQIPGHEAQGKVPVGQ